MGAQKEARNSSTDASSNSSRARSTSHEYEELRDKFNASALSCYEDNVTYAPLDMLGHAMTKEANASECHARCSRLADCSFFTFYTLTRDCHVTGEAALKQVGIGCVGGPVNCRTVEASFLTRSVNIGNVGGSPCRCICSQLGSSHTSTFRGHPPSQISDAIWKGRRVGDIGRTQWRCLMYPSRVCLN